ncbi:MAG: hypothetical protein ACYC4L_00905 [Chloroflexota bacterium]
MEIDKYILDWTLEQLHVQPVGRGYIDCICPKANIAGFIDAMNKLGIRITEFTWWCFVDEGHKSCGYGGPSNRFGPGWYSEIGMATTYEVSSNEEARKY